jgi:peptide/nickel transport system substrate-binding protein
VAASLLVAACGTGEEDSSSSDGGSEDTTLDIAVATDMDPADPDNNYQFEGNQVMMSVYEGLVEYDPVEGGTEIVPLLADSYEVSDDGLTYTFDLKDDVVFHDGTPFDSAAAQASFERRAAGELPYMLWAVDGYETPDADTFVVNLTTPDSSFIANMAGPFGVKMVSPTAIEENAEGDDLAAGWLATNEAGTGPYEMTSFEAGTGYTLEAFADHWGDTPEFETVDISIVPEQSSQVVQLEGGDLDLLSGQPVNTLDDFADRDGYQLVTAPTLQKAWLHVNPNTEPFDDLELREALRTAIDRDVILEEVFGGYAEESTSLYPAGMLPEGMAPDEWEVDTEALADLVAELPEDERSVQLGISESFLNTRFAEHLQARMAEAGLDVEILAAQPDQIYAWTADPASAPDLVFELAYPDAAHPDTWGRLFMGSEGALNYLGGGSPEVDALFDEGLATTDQAEIDAAYDEAGQLLYDQATFISIADVPDVFIARDDLDGFSHWIPTPVTLKFADLTSS